MARGKVEDAGRLTPVKDDNEAARHFIRRTLPIFNCVDYIAARPEIVRPNRSPARKSPRNKRFHMTKKSVLP